jgi:hypothetical protein
MRRCSLGTPGNLAPGDVPLYGILIDADGPLSDPDLSQVASGAKPAHGHFRDVQPLGDLGPVQQTAAHGTLARRQES